MTIKQLSIFIENRGGTLIKVLDLFSRAGVQIIASTVADTKDYGIYRVLCDKPTQAYLILREAGINVQLTDVIAVAIDDKPGSAARVINSIAEGKLSLLYMYSFLWKGQGVLIFRTDNNEKAGEIITLNKFSVLTELDFA